jgi:hypothetical protein
MVINHSIENNNNATVFIIHRLLPARDVNDGQATVAQTQTGLDVKSIPIGATMRQAICHPAQASGINRHRAL